jgi:VanZ family protein
MGLYGGLEHALAYAVAAGIFTVSYYPRWWSVLIGLSVIAGLLEILQLFASGRHSQLADFLASFLGVIAGSLFVRIMLRFTNVSAR